MSRNCKQCGTEFEPIAKAHWLCSDKCRTEAKKSSKKKYQQKPEQKKVWARLANEWRKKNYVRSRFTALRNRANANGIPFDLTESDVVIPDICPVLGIAIDGLTKDTQWSFDKLKPEKGYVKGNVFIISMKANRLKNNATVEELEKIIEYIKNNS